MAEELVSVDFNVCKHVDSRNFDRQNQTLCQKGTRESGESAKADFISVVEISKGSNMKYELDKETGMLILDRVLFTATHYPMNYGFIPRTYGDDHDPLEVLVLCSEAIEPLTLVRSYPIGVMRMEDSGLGDEKIIAIPYGDPAYMRYTDISQLPTHIFEELKHFFSVYKSLEGKTTVVNEFGGALEAVQVIENALENYKEKFGKA